jgi:hypothetical protein
MSFAPFLPRRRLHMNWNAAHLTLDGPMCRTVGANEAQHWRAAAFTTGLQQARPLSRDSRTLSLLRTYCSGR